jgi:ABC-type multidrug transport system fused ATPase/permease subunit
MKNIKLAICLILLLAMFSMPIQAQDMKKIAQAGMQFLKIDGTARGAAMAGAMTVDAFNASAVFYNPASLSWLESDFDIMANNTRWIADISYNHIAAAYSLESIGTFALSGVFTDYGDIERTQLSGDGYVSKGNINVGAYSFGLSYARNLMDNFSIGGTVKYVNQELGTSVMNDDSEKENKVDGWAFDFGTVFYPGWESFRFGISIRNFSREYQYEQESFELPLTFTIGAAMNMFDFVELEDQSLLLSIDAVHPRDYTERVHFGLEYQFMQLVSVRAGYKTNHDIEGLSGGLGVNFEFSGIGARVDYAYSDIQYFDAVHRVSAGFSF